MISAMALVTSRNTPRKRGIRLLIKCLIACLSACSLFAAVGCSGPLGFGGTVDSNGKWTINVSGAASGVSIKSRSLLDDANRGQLVSSER